MTAEDFCVWLKGYLDLEQANGKVNITTDQADTIQKHLQLVFKYDELINDASESTNFSIAGMQPQMKDWKFNPPPGDHKIRC